MEEQQSEEYAEDYIQMTLNWAASMEDGYPSERLGFLKRFLALCTHDELRRAKKMVQINRRRNNRDFKQAEFNVEKQSLAQSTVAEPTFSDAVASTVDCGDGWWSIYDAEDIVALDTEQVSKRIVVDPNSPAPKEVNQPKKSKKKQQPTYDPKVASLDVAMIGGEVKSVYSTLVHHAPGSFLDDGFWKKLTGFNTYSFSSETLPSEEDIKREMTERFSKKLIVTVGGEADFRAMGLSMADFNYFDLQSHFYVEKMDPHGVLVRGPHSLRSLAAFYLGTTQGSTHTSFEDAKMTLELFEVYKKLKMEGDKDSRFERFNDTTPYNHIPVLKKPK